MVGNKTNHPFNCLYMTPEGLRIYNHQRGYQFINNTDPLNSLPWIIDGYPCEISAKKLCGMTKLQSLILLFRLAYSHRKIHNDWRNYQIYSQQKTFYLSTTVMRGDIANAPCKYPSTFQPPIFLMTIFQDILSTLKPRLILKTGIMITNYFDQGWRVICYHDYQITYVKYLRQLADHRDQQIDDIKIYMGNKYGLIMNDIDVLNEGIDFDPPHINNKFSKFKIHKFLTQVTLSPRLSKIRDHNDRRDQDKKYWVIMGLKITSTLSFLLGAGLLVQLLQGSYYGYQWVMQRHHMAHVTKRITDLCKKLNFNPQEARQLLVRLKDIQLGNAWEIRLSVLSTLSLQGIKIKELVWRYQPKEILEETLIVRFRPVHDWDDRLMPEQWADYQKKLQGLWPKQCQMDAVQQSVTVNFIE